VATTDTTPQAEAVRSRIQRDMTGEERFLLAYQMSMFVREIAMEGIRRDHADWTEEQVARELLRRAFFPAPLPAWLRRAFKTYSRNLPRRLIGQESPTCFLVPSLAHITAPRVPPKISM